MARWESKVVRLVSWRRRSVLCALALSLTSCQLYVSSRELDADGGTISDGASDGDAATGCRHPEDSECGYRFKRELTFNAQPLQEVLVDFPVLVTLDDTRIDYAQTQPRGADLRFVDDDGTLLAHEIEQWRPGGVSSIWVRIPRFDPRTRKTITYFYGSDTARALSTSAQVFSAYEAVYHLSDSLAVNRVIRDARRRHDGKPSNNVNPASSVAGVVGSGLELSAGRFVELPDLEDSNLTALTIEFWLREPMPRSHERVMCREGADGPVACLGLHNGGVEFTLTTQGSGATSISEVADETVGTQWTHIAMIWDASTQNLRILRNGVQTRSSYRVTGATLATSNLPWLLGNSSSSQAFSGEIDELRIAHVARSNTWMLATVAIVSEPFPIKNYGEEQPLR